MPVLKILGMLPWITGIPVGTALVVISLILIAQRHRAHDTDPASSEPGPGVSRTSDAPVSEEEKRHSCHSRNRFDTAPIEHE
eukprot:g32572.t1